LGPAQARSEGEPGPALLERIRGVPVQLERRRGSLVDLTVRPTRPAARSARARPRLAHGAHGQPQIVHLRALRHHFEQNFHVRNRLRRYEAGRCMGYDEAAEPDALAEAIAKEVQREVNYRPVETDGAERAGAMLAELL
jgi:hypothetical protein